MSLKSDIITIVDNSFCNDDIVDGIYQYIVEDILADLYKESYPAVGRLCDEKLDRSGRLLGEVIGYARYGKGE